MRIDDVACNTCQALPQGGRVLTEPSLTSSETAITGTMGGYRLRSLRASTAGNGAGAYTRPLFGSI
jgi:hypothetical protein